MTSNNVTRDSFCVYLRSLPASGIGFRVTDTGQHILNITRDVGLYVTPGEDDMTAVADGLRALAAAAHQMADALNRLDGGR